MILYPEVKSRPFTEAQSLEVCLEMAVKFAATENEVDDSHAPWLRLAVSEIRAGRLVTVEDIKRFRDMGTTEA